MPEFIRQPRLKGYTVHMSYLTLEVQIDHGKVIAKAPAILPDKASGLLTIFQPDAPGKLTPLQALDALQKHMQLDSQKAGEWMNSVHAARR